MGRLLYDMMQRPVEVPQDIRRIVSLVPSQTELLYDLGLDEEVVGITKFCIHPSQWFQSKTRVGGTKKLHLEKIVALQPDVVIANKEENTQAEIEWLAERIPVWISDIQTLPDAFTMISEVGSLCGRTETAASLIQAIKMAFLPLQSASPVLGKRVAYFIWRKPWMCAAPGTFIDEMLKAGGWENAFAHLQRYPEIDIEQLQSVAPELIFLSSEPYPFREKHIAELQELLPDAHISLVDGELFSWYGSRLLGTASYLKELRHQTGTAI